MTKTTAPKTTKAAPAKVDTTRTTELADAEMNIDKVSGDDGTESAENSANQDVADGMREAKTDELPNGAVGQAFPGEGPASGI